MENEPPINEEIVQTPPALDRTEKQGPKPKNNSKIAIIILALLATAGLGFGVYGFFFKKSEEKPAQDTTNTSETESELTDLKTKYSVLQNYVKELEASGTEIAEEVKSATTAETIATEDYIYVGEWGIKIKIPEGLKLYHYDYHSYTGAKVIGSDGTEIKTAVLCIGAATTGRYEGIPSFADKCMYALAKNIGQVADDQGSFWQYKVPSGEFYQVGPQALLGNESEVEWETESVNAIKDWLSDQSARSAI